MNDELTTNTNYNVIWSTMTYRYTAVKEKNIFNVQVIIATTKCFNTNVKNKKNFNDSIYYYLIISNIRGSLRTPV